LTVNSSRMMRGKSFLDSAENLRSASRVLANPEEYNSIIGVRCARTP
jgi:formylglycine-generating enzyme required for sulfatase activity